MAKFNLKSLMVTVIFAVLFFSAAPQLVYTMGTGIANFLGSITGNTTVYGSTAGTIATVLANNWGLFLVAGVLSLIISVAGGIFAYNSYSKRRRRY